jgi:O-methyltransferase
MTDDVRHRSADGAGDVRSYDVDDAIWTTWVAVRDYTMTSSQRVIALCEAIRYICANRIGGDIVECGVWRGGSMLAAARTLLEQRDKRRTLWLYDTFTGMPRPSFVDRRSADGVAAADLLAQAERTSDLWAVSDLDEVRHTMSLCDYPSDGIRYIAGRVEETIPRNAPEAIALLRLDTDWYESTLHELKHLLPRVTPGGILIIDDYGHWQGARRAVDEYLETAGTRLFLARIDYTGRIAVMPG